MSLVFYAAIFAIAPGLASVAICILWLRPAARLVSELVALWAEAGAEHRDSRVMLRFGASALTLRDLCASRSSSRQTMTLSNAAPVQVHSLKANRPALSLGVGNRQALG